MNHYTLLLRPWLAIALTSGLMLCIPPQTVQGQDSAVAPAKQVDEDILSLQKKLKSPRDAVESFLNAMDSQDFKEAYQCLDLGELDAETAAAKQKTYAVKLHLALTKYLARYQLLTLSSDATEEAPYSISDEAQLQGIELVPDADGIWRFSRATVKLLEGDAFDFLLADAQLSAQKAEETAWSFPIWLQTQFDESWWGTTFLLKDYQWVCLLILLLGGFLIGQVVKLLFDYLTQIWFRMTSTDVDDRPRKQLWTPVIFLIHILIWYYGTTQIDLPSSVMRVVLPVLKFFSVIAAVWTAFRAINLLQNYLAKKAKLTATRYDDSLVPLLCSALKIVAVALGVILFVDVFDKDWKAVLGGFGVVGIAVAIAAKDMLGNVFGSITVLADRPFEVGDWVVIDGNVEGTVEHVGMRSSRLRTFHNSEIIVPNSVLTTAIVDNMGRRKLRRLKTMLQIRYDTPTESIEAFCTGVRKIIHDNPYAKSEHAHVYLNQFGESSIDILLYMFFECNDWSTELRERHCVLLDIMKLAEHLGVGFAFPTRTLEFEGVDGPPSSATASN